MFQFWICMRGILVATVNLTEIPKQVGDAVLLFDPLNIDDIAEKIYLLWSDPVLRRTMSEKGLKQVAGMTQTAYAEKWMYAIEKMLQLQVGTGLF